MPEKLAVLGALAVGALLASPPPLAAQNTGGIEGQVRDDAGRPLSAAEVIVRAPGEAIAGRAATDGNGAWRITFLAPGRYQLLIRRLGYRPATREIAIEPGIVARLTVVLEPVPLMLDSLVASAPAVSVSTTDNELGSRLTRREIALLPTTLDARPLISLTPGARPNQIWGGASDQANSYVLDGTLVNHPGVGGVFFTPSVSWIDRLEVKGLGAGAEYGNFQGGLVNVVTRSGGNTLEGEVRSAVESRQFNGSNLIPGEIGRELSNRWEVDAQVRGPLVRDRLHFALFGHFIHEDERVLNQLPGVADRFAPDAPGLDDRRGLAKLSWRLGERDLVQATFWGRSRDGERTGQTGFEAPEATERLRHWIGAGNLTWQRNWSPRNALEVRLGGFASRERREPYGGSDLPGVETLILVDPAGYQNAPFRTRAEPTSLSADATWTLRGRAGGLEHELRLGAEYVAGSWEFEQLRNGGMTWRPYPREEFDPPTPATWFTGALLNSSWGGEVRLDSDVRNGAVFVQDYIRLSPWVQLNPGFRLGWWSGHLTPTGGQRFTAVRDEAVDPRIGVVVDLSGRGTFAAKVHWGRYHQSMFAAFFDRVEGGQVYNNEEIWAYRGPAFADPGTRFTEAERDALAASGGFTLEQRIGLDQVGRVENYKQPYVDQTVVSLEKTFGTRWKATTAYVRRRNRNMVAVVDRNLEDNYHVQYANVIVLDRFGRPLHLNGKPLVLDRLAISNEDVAFWIEELRAGRVDIPPLILPPGYPFPELQGLRYQPDLVLTTVPEATRRFDQLQLQLEARYPTWWTVASATFTDLRGNLNVVTGPDDFTNGGPGPWVRLNEQTNFFGALNNQSRYEAKLQVGGLLPWNFRGGAFFSYLSGDRVTPTLTLSNLLNEFAVVLPDPENPAQLDTLPLPGYYTRLTSGHRIFLQPRGEFRYPERFNLDLHLERSFPSRGAEVIIAVDAFNVLGSRTITGIETAVNSFGSFFGTDYGRVRARVPPRTVRLGAAVRF